MLPRYAAWQSYLSVELFIVTIENHETNELAKAAIKKEESVTSLIIENHGATRLIKINRPKVYNALTKEAKNELTSAIEMAGNDSSVRSIVLTAEGKAFCSGQDLNDRAVKGQGEQRPDLGHTLRTEWNPLISSIRDCPKPVIGAINGVCAGAGLSVALACDLRIAHPSARFVSGFSKLGLCPDAGSTFTLTRALGGARTLEFFLFNRPFEAATMHQAGLVNTVDEQFLDTALEWAQEINKMAPQAIQIIKANVKLAAEHMFHEMIEVETSAQATLGASDDYQEGLAAFFEKRTPNFKGL